MRLSKLIKPMAILATLISTQAYAVDTSLHEASHVRLLQAACPQNWSYFDRAIPSENSTSPPTSVSWSNTADKDDFRVKLKVPKNYHASKGTYKEFINHCISVS